MNKHTLICITASLLLCVGCASMDLKPTSSCQPLSAFTTIVISPFNADNALVEEDKYKDLPRKIAAASTDRLKDQLEDNHVFGKVLVSTECADHAIKIDGKIYSLIHHKRSYHVDIGGQVINCQTGEVMYKYRNSDEQDSESIILPDQIAGKLMNGIKDKLICEQPKPAPALVTNKDKK